MTAPRTGWIATLDQFEAGIERFEAELDASDAAELSRVETWQPPVGLGPLPGELRQRATSLSWRMTAMEQRARDRRDALQCELDDLGRRRGAGAAYAAAGPNVTHTDQDD